MAKQLGGPASTGVLVYSGEIIHDRGEMLSLTDMWRANGSDPAKQPAKWRELPSTREFASHVAGVILRKSEDKVFRVTRGRQGETWAHWHLGLAYARYLSHEFHAACNEAVREKMESRRADALPSDILDLIPRMDGMLRMLAHKVTVLEKTPAPALSVEVIERIAENAIARRLFMARRGRTVGQIYREAGFPPIKGISCWLGNLWVRLGFQIEGNGHGELGDRTARLFDPDKVSAWLRSGGRATINTKLAERRGQAVFKLVPMTKPPQAPA